MRSLMFISLLFILGCGSDEDPLINDGTYPGYALLWADEFNSEINSDNWTYELGNGTDYGLPPGWGNNELQLYTNSVNNSGILPDGDKSALVITAKKEAGDNKFSSAKLTSQGLQSFRFGRIEASIKVPSGQGLWPAFWLLGDNINQVDWPGCGEIDVMEVIGNEPNVVHCSAHYANSENKLSSNSVSLDLQSSLADDYHLYRVDWTLDEMIFSIDDQIVQSTPIEDDAKEFLRSFYIIFNVAVGGNWPGTPDQTTDFPQRMYVDWVRVYSKNDLLEPLEPALDIAEETVGVISFDLPKHALNSSFNSFDGAAVRIFGDGGEPDLSSSSISVEGDSSLLLTYPGNTWGGAFFELTPTIDISTSSALNLVFSINAPVEMTDIEVKLESIATASSLFLVNYTGVEVGNGFKEYRIPLSDFDGLDLTDIKIPFALWNPKTANDEYFVGDVLLDNIYLE